MNFNKRWGLAFAVPISLLCEPAASQTTDCRWVFGNWRCETQPLPKGVDAADLLSALRQGQMDRAEKDRRDAALALDEQARANLQFHTRLQRDVAGLLAVGKCSEAIALALRSGDLDIAGKAKNFCASPDLSGTESLSDPSRNRTPPVSVLSRYWVGPRWIVDRNEDGCAAILNDGPSSLFVRQSGQPRYLTLTIYSARTGAQAGARYIAQAAFEGSRNDWGEINAVGVESPRFGRGMVIQLARGPATADLTTSRSVNFTTGGSPYASFRLDGASAAIDALGRCDRGE